MADDDQVTPQAGELTTANYGWVKPNVGNSDDAWGGMLNADLDGIDTTVKSVSTVANAAYPAANPSGYQTAAQVTAAVPVASSTTPVMDGTAAVGVGTTWARADHKHPSDTTKYDASNPAGYQTAAQVDGARYGDNRIINGDMRIDQRNNGASGTASVYTVDRWVYSGTAASKGTWGQRLNAVLSLAATGGFPYYLGFQSSSAYATPAGEIYQLRTALEGDAISDFLWGLSGSQPVTLSFWAYSSLTGTFSGAIRDYGPPSTRSYPFTYSIPVANTWTKIVLTIPGDTAGSWGLGTNAGALYLTFDLGSGSTFRGPANAWAAGNYVGATGSVSIVAVNAATFYVTGVKLEIGSVATSYNRQSLTKSMADCQRYYQTMGAQPIWSGQITTAWTYYTWVTFPVAMRATPTMTLADVNNSGFPAGVPTTQNVAPYGYQAYKTANATATAGFYGFSYSASAEL